MVVRGELTPGRDCGSFILTTDAADTRFYSGAMYWHYSLARMAHREEVRVPYELAFDFGRLTPGAWHLEVHALGVVVFLGLERISYFLDATQFAREIWTTHPELAQPGPHRLVVRQNAREISLLLDGKPLHRRSLPAPVRGTIAIGIRGAPGHRSRMAIRNVTLDSPAQRASTRLGATRSGESMASHRRLPH